MAKQYIGAVPLVPAADPSKQDALTFGIANTNAVRIDSASVADNEYARFTANGLESRSNAEVLSDIGAQAANTTIPRDGWDYISASTCEYVSADAPSFVMRFNADITGELSLGMRIKITQTTDKFFIVTAIGAYSGGYTPVTVYGGTDYTLANATITYYYYSAVKAPAGFPTDPLKWSVIATDTTNRMQSSPVPAMYYNLGSSQISVPIGTWKLSFSVNLTMVCTSSTTTIGMRTSLSTSSSEPDLSLTGYYALIATGIGQVTTPVYKEKQITVTSKTLYYLISAVTSISGGTVTELHNLNAVETMTLRAECGYL